MGQGAGLVSKPSVVATAGPSSLPLTRVGVDGAACFSHKTH